MSYIFMHAVFNAGLHSAWLI